MANTTITVQPGVMLPAYAKTSTWSTGLCDCCDDMSVCEYLHINDLIERKGGGFLIQLLYAAFICNTA